MFSAMLSPYSGSVHSAIQYMNAVLRISCMTLWSSHNTRYIATHLLYLHHAWLTPCERGLYNTKFVKTSRYLSRPLIRHLSRYDIIKTHMFRSGHHKVLLGRTLGKFTQLKRNKRFDIFIMLVGVQGSLFHIAAGSHPVQKAWGHKKVASMLSKTIPKDSSYDNDSEKV